MATSRHFIFEMSVGNRFGELKEKLFGLLWGKENIENGDKKEGGEESTRVSAAALAWGRFCAWITSTENRLYVF